MDNRGCWSYFNSVKREINMNFGGIEEKYRKYETSKIVVLPLGYEKTTSYIKGTKNAPEAIINASTQVELYDEETDFEAYKLGIFTDLSLVDINKYDPEEAIELTKNTINNHIKNKKFVVSLGGEHTISLAPITAYIENFENLSIVQFDAHADLRDSYENQKLNHACIMRRVYEIYDHNKIHQIGIRSLSIEERNFIKKQNLSLIYKYKLDKTPNIIDELYKKINKNIYLTIDIDAFDPAIVPQVGTPEPNGLNWQEFFNIFKKFSDKNIVGFDIVELCPAKNLIMSDFFCAKLIYKMLSCIFYKQNIINI
jgi:agmatinase